MIARVWRGHTRAEDAGKYGAFLEAKGFGDHRSTSGDTGAVLLKRVAETPVIPRRAAPRDPVLDSGPPRSSPGSLAALGMTG
jgi:hypothetical protein